MNRTRLLKIAKRSIPPSRGFTALGPAFVLLLLGVSCLKVDPENNARLDKEALSAIPHGHHKRVCDDATPGSVRCHARVRTNAAGDVQPLTTPSGFGPSALQSAYLVPTGGAGQTVAIVDAYDDPYAESELATYRSQFGLPPCTTANGCFKKVNQNGATSPLPAADSGWAVEIALDLAMVSAICPSCNILLVEASSATMSDLGAAENAAAALGPAAISNSWGGGDSSSSTTFDTLYFNHPGILITVSSGDNGYGVEYPASSQYVLGVGGTSMAVSSSSRGWAESVWDGAGSGCSAYIDKPSLQTDPGCSKRTVADVSAVADPNTGVAVYSSYQGGWLVVGGTSASSPIVAAIFAAAGKATAGAGFPYTHTSAFYDVTTGSNGSCSPAYLCSGQVGFDGPTGWGTPNGQLIAASSDVAQVFSVTFNPSIIEGGSPSTGTVLLTAFAPAGGATVTLANSVPGMVTVPSSVVVPAGSQRVTFPVTTVQTSTQTVASIQATYPVSTSVTGTLTLLASPTPASLVLSPTSVSGGTTSIGTVTLSGPAPAGGADVSLSSSNVASATVPATMNIPEGASSGTFTITTLAQSSSSSANISAAYHGLTRSATLAVTMTPGVSSISVSSSLFEGGGSATGTVYLNIYAPSGGAVVALSSSSTAVNVPASITVTAGLSSATFAIATTAVTAQTVVTISATCSSTTTKTTTLTVVPSPTPLSVTLTPSTVAGGNSSTGTVLLSGPAPAGGSVVTLASSLTSSATVPASLSIPAGTTSGTFTVTTLAQTTTRTATISASLNGLSASAVLTVTKVLPVGNATFDATLKVPRCLTVGSFCDTGGMIDGRGSLGPETNTPNTINATCTDGTSGTYHSDESLDRLKVSTTDGSLLAAGKTVLVEATVWSYSTSDSIDLYFAPDATNPVWTLLVTKPTTVSQQVQVLSTSFVLPSATLPAIRGNFRFNGSVGSCTTGSYDDHDDLVFALSTTTPVNQPPVVSAGSIQTITLPATANLNGTVADDGLPNPPGAVTVTWSMDSGPGTVTFANPAAAATAATFSVAGAYVLRLTASDSALSASATVTITVNPATPVNQPPSVSAGSNQTITLPATASLSGTVTDDGLPNPPGAVTVSWSMDSGPGTVTFANPAAAAATATFSVAGVYVLRLTANDSALTTSAPVTITVNPAAPVNQAPVVNAGSNQTITLPAAASLNGTVTDDGLPNPPGAVTVTWSMDSGPGTVTFANSAAMATTATFSVAGAYTLRLTANDGALSASATVAITVNAAPVNQAPVVSAGSNQTITLPATANLSGTATDDGLPNPPGAVTVTWSKTSGSGTVTFANSAAKVTTATFSAAGTYVLKLTASDGSLSASATVTITVNAAPVNQAPVVNAGANQTITLPAAASLNGTVTDDGLPNPPGAVTVTWSKTSGPGTVTFANPAAKVTTATFSAAGTYVLKLTASDSALSASASTTITVNAAANGACAGLCTSPTIFTINGNYQSGNIGTGAVCYQTTSVVHGGNCSNVVSPRTVKVNGTTETCGGGNWSSIPAARNGGYCIQTTSGNQSYASFALW
jgi:subtilase family serine protease